MEVVNVGENEERAARKAYHVGADLTAKDGVLGDHDCMHWRRDGSVFVALKKS